MWLTPVSELQISTNMHDRAVPGLREAERPVTFFIKYPPQLVP